MVVVATLLAGWIADKTSCVILVILEATMDYYFLTFLSNG